jgi:hypothetical protein
MSGAGLPNAHLALVADVKVSLYLLDPAHPNNGGKAAFFNRFGFTQLSSTALRIHPQANPVIRVMPNPYGTKYLVECSLLSPDGRNPCIHTVWIIDPSGTAPRLVTAFPYQCRPQADRDLLAASTKTSELPVTAAPPISHTYFGCLFLECVLLVLI